MIENEHCVSHLSLLCEARHELRSHLALETALIEHISTLPEDDFCHQARESMSLGAGYAYMQRQAGDNTHLDHVFAAFFATQPRNRYLDEETVALEQKHIIDAAFKHLEDRGHQEIDPAIDPYTVEAAVAFIDGYVLTKEYFESQGLTFLPPMVESA